MREKGKIFFIIECQLINAQGVMELEAHRCAIIIAMDSGRNETFAIGKEYLYGLNISFHI